MIPNRDFKVTLLSDIECLQNDLYCVEWDIKRYCTVLYLRTGMRYKPSYNGIRQLSFLLLVETSSVATHL